MEPTEEEGCWGMKQQRVLLSLFFQNLVTIANNWWGNWSSRRSFEGELRAEGESGNNWCLGPYRREK